MVRQGGAGEAEELVTVDLDMWSNRLFGLGGKAGQMVRVQCKLLKILFEKSVFSTWCKQWLVCSLSLERLDLIS